MGVDMTITLEDQEIRLSRAGQRAIRELRKVRALQDELKIKATAYEKTLRTELDAVPLGTRLFGTVGGVRVCSLSRSIRKTLNRTLLGKRVEPDVIEECTVESVVDTFKIMGE